MKTPKLTPSAVRMIDGLPDDVIVYSLSLMRWTAKGLGTAAPAPGRLYTPAQLKVWQRLKALVRREKQRGSR